MFMSVLSFTCHASEGWHPAAPARAHDATLDASLRWHDNA
jgi:hypothetical protein